MTTEGKEIERNYLNPCQRCMVLDCLLHKPVVKSKGEWKDVAALDTVYYNTVNFYEEVWKALKQKHTKKSKPTVDAPDFSKECKNFCQCIPCPRVSRNTERPCAAPKTGRDANKDICLGSASRGKTLKQFFPQPVEKIKLQLRQPKGRISSLIFPWLQSMGKNFQEV